MAMSRGGSMLFRAIGEVLSGFIGVTAQNSTSMHPHVQADDLLREGVVRSDCHIGMIVEFG
jgi:hypothetical protein